MLWIPLGFKELCCVQVRFPTDIRRFSQAGMMSANDPTRTFGTESLGKIST
jgi:hypothetical protein